MTNQSRTIAKKDPSAQRLQQSRQVEIEEHNASASAQAGLSLNILGALSCALSSKSKKTTHQNCDGSTHYVEDRHEAGQAYGQAAANGAAFAAVNANEGRRKQKALETVDHLGIEGRMEE
ncbi:hypothetical protein K432DRAFT_306843 [Lepidopterella palustris CBS 459.81]|uniref:Uncharacterized protein n=1 Tax=Lepidopterella palustris CBS 459.81 TaxID=1314670 RepID=A0A8E2JBD3_9PEZI|nr:hypothetical protein K432DRAFT_306843 [Lepidopterella palustris CBS 459.81]